MEPTPTSPPPPVPTCYRHPDRRAGVRCQRCERPICPSCMSTASVGFHCPECAKGGRQRVYTRATLAQANRPIVTQLLIAANAIVYVLGVVEQSSNSVAGRGGFISDGGLSAFAVEQGDWWRIVTSGFLHAGLIHLAFNMFALFTLGSLLEPAMGRARFVAVYAFSLLAGSLGVLTIQPDSLTVGASGAVFGLMGALVIAQRARGIDPWSSGVGSVIAINLLITFTIPGISIGGHLGGLVGGLLGGWVLLDVGPRAFGDRGNRAWVPLAFVVALGAAVFAACLVVA